jgi:hypothetical protein
MIHDVIAIVSPACILFGIVLRMWDALAEADSHGEFAPRTSREEMHRLRLFFTLMDRVEHPSTPDKELYYLRTAQGWFFLALGATGALLLAMGAVLSD